MNEWIYTIIVCVAVYEFIEHIGLPLFWAIKNRKRNIQSGPLAMIGKNCRVVQWKGHRGKVTIKSELWNAESEEILAPGSDAVILKVQGLTLIVTPAIR